MADLRVEIVPIDSIRPYERNPRKNDAAVDAVAASIREFGFQQPIVCDTDGVVIVGHTRLKAAKKLGMKTVPVVYANLTSDKAKAYRLADNKTSELSDWNFEHLEIELGDIELDMEQFGFEDEEDKKDAEAMEDDYEPDPPKEPKAKRGDIYQLGRHRLMCGDSTLIDDVEKLMNGAKADMLFTDPPYGVDYASKNKYLNTISTGNRIQVPIKNDNLDIQEEKDRLWVPAFSNARIVADDKCAYYIASPQGGEFMMIMMMAICEAGWQLKHMIIWNKNCHVLGRSDYNYKHEPILYGWNQQHNFYGKGKFKSSVWDIPKPQKSDLHPTMKPIALVLECLLNSTKAGDNVLDVFGGSGTTLMACEQTERNCFMMEYEPHYIDVIIDRWEKFTGKKAELIDA